ncbi:hypothetical protein [Desulforhopalus singaporensis]|uniref:Uncharacterized protein n=1 Tax=Desulforhopalus singaporensis TaxID=91360 RepID=A0A1H0W184_9BACT|nr:hypothetical protein [Desulforhopalus singaporensis]SDP84126.1 hypothetical protein SAMN05660330_04347 [Desulforhopalus singaporensis]
MEQHENIENRSRRRAVKTIVVGVGGLAAYHTLPVNWSAPVINQIFLPAHAQTSGEIPSVETPVATAGPVSVTFTGIFENPVDEIYLDFDGTNATLYGGTSGPNSNTVFQIDGDWDFANWDWYVNGSNWPQTPDNWSGPSPTPSGTGENNQQPGSYSFEADYGGPGGGRFRIHFTVTITPTTPYTSPANDNDSRTMTVSNVEIYAI